MEQMQVDESMKINLDMSDEQVPAMAKILQPVVFSDGDSFCALLGPDPQIGIFGCGNTPIGALLDWNTHLKETIENADNNDEVVSYVRSTLESQKHIL